MTAAEAKRSPHWPADIKMTEDITWGYCPPAAAYVLLRPSPQVPVCITYPGTAEITRVVVLGIEDARRIVREVHGSAFALVKTPARPWSDAT